MKTAKFIAVFLCGAIVMAGMSFTRSACTMSQDTPADITTPTDVISAETQITAEVTTHTTSEETTAPTDSLTTSATNTTTTASRTTTTAKTTTSTTRTSTAQTTAKTTTKPTTTTTAATTTRATSTAKPTTTTTQSSTRTTTTTAATTTAATTFDISKYSTYAMSYGQSIGLIYDSGVSSFDTPLILSSATTSPEKRIRDRLDGYAASGYTRFKVWTEYRESDGKWKLYIAYG